MYITLINKIKDTIAAIPEVKEYFAYPEKKYTKFPTVIFYPSNSDNAYETTNENSKVYRFKMFILIGIGGTTKQAVFESTMPKTIDAIEAKFDSDWDFGNVDGHRVRAIIDTAYWDSDIAQDGEIAYAELNLSIKVLTNN